MPSNKKNTRMCCACREHADKSELLRIVKAPNGEIKLDPTNQADGRGVWLHNNEVCKSKVVKRKLLNSAFKCSVSEDIYEQLKGR